jgi:hypothetical protein
MRSWSLRRARFDGDIAVIWERSGDVFYASVTTAAAEILFYLVVEPLPDQSWDWAVWRPGETTACSGITATIHSAMRSAELAAR